MLIEDMLNSAIENKARESIDIKETEIGTIESISPLKIRVEGLLLNYDDLYINYDLMEHTRYFTKLTGTSGANTTTIENGSIIFKSILKIGDKVAMREVNDGRYHVMSKVKGGY